MGRRIRVAAAWSVVAVLLPSSAWAAPPTEAEDQGNSALTGFWTGTYSYPDIAQREDVDFSAIVVHDGEKLAGFIKERNTFGDVGDPWLHAWFEGTYDGQTSKLKFTKTYDGTATADHDVLYSGRLSGDKTSVLGGTWEIPNVWGGRFTLNKEADTRAGPFSGVWTGTQHYPEGSDRPSVKFTLIMVHQGKEGELTGLIKERRTSGDGADPWLHGSVKGRFDGATGQLTIVKTYDGTAGETGEAEYRGQFSAAEESVVNGTWQAGSDTGSFTLARRP